MVVLEGFEPNHAPLIGRESCQLDDKTILKCGKVGTFTPPYHFPPIPEWKEEFLLRKMVGPVVIERCSQKELISVIIHI